MTDLEGIDIKDFLDESSGDVSGVLRYKPGNSLIHRLNPVTKFVMAIGFIVVAWLAPTYWLPLWLFCILAGIMLVFRLHRSMIPVVLFVGSPIAVSLFLLHGLFNPANETPLIVIESIPYVTASVPVVGKVIFYREGIDFALLFFFRIMVLLLGLLLAIVSTHPRELVVALNDKGMPQKLAYVFLASLQLVPQMRSEISNILEAQQSRGLDTHANVFKRMKAFFALMTPLIISALITAETRALALESRGFGMTSSPSSIFEVDDTRLDRVLRWGTAVAVVVIGIWVVVL